MSCGPREVQLEGYEAVIILDGAGLAVVDPQLEEEDVTERVTCDVSSIGLVHVKGCAVYGQPSTTGSPTQSAYACI